MTRGMPKPEGHFVFRGESIFDKLAPRPKEALRKPLSFPSRGLRAVTDPSPPPSGADAAAPGRPRVGPSADQPLAGSPATRDAGEGRAYDGLPVTTDGGGGGG